MKAMEKWVTAGKRHNAADTVDARIAVEALLLEADDGNGVHLSAASFARNSYRLNLVVNAADEHCLTGLDENIGDAGGQDLLAARRELRLWKYGDVYDPSYESEDSAGQIEEPESGARSEDLAGSAGINSSANYSELEDYQDSIPEDYVDEVEGTDGGSDPEGAGAHGAATCRFAPAGGVV